MSKRGVNETAAAATLLLLSSLIPGDLNSKGTRDPMEPLSLVLKSCEDFAGAYVVAMEGFAEIMKELEPCCNCPEGKALLEEPNPSPSSLESTLERGVQGIADLTVDTARCCKKCAGIEDSKKK